MIGFDLGLISFDLGLILVLIWWDFIWFGLVWFGLIWFWFSVIWLGLLYAITKRLIRFATIAFSVAML